MRDFCSHLRGKIFKNFTIRQHAFDTTSKDEDIVHTISNNRLNAMSARPSGLKKVPSVWLFAN